MAYVPHLNIHNVKDPKINLGAASTGRTRREDGSLGSVMGDTCWFNLDVEEVTVTVFFAPEGELPPREKLRLFLRNLAVASAAACDEFEQQYALSDEADAIETRIYGQSISID